MSANEPEEATLVLIGSIGSDARCWDFIGIPEGHPVEYPGHGSRERQPGWTYESFCEEIVSSFDGPLDIIGVALGGTVVANLLTRHPGRIRSALMVSCAPPIDVSPEQWEKRVATSSMRARMPADDGMAAVLDDTLARWFTPWAVRTNQPGVRYARETLLAMDPDAWFDIWTAGALSEPLSSESIRQVTQPVTIVGSTNDFASGLATAGLMHRLIPNSRYEVMPISHMSHLEHPEFVKEAIDRHRVWTRIGQRVEDPIGSGVWLPVEDISEDGRVLR